MDCFVARGAPRNDDVTHIWTSSIYDEPIPQKNSHFQVRAVYYYTQMWNNEKKLAHVMYFVGDML